MKSFMCFAIIFMFWKCATSIKSNNVCKTIRDYSIRDISPNCWYNPDVTASAQELILRNGYPLETYEAITEDFYILTIFRIPPKNNSSKGIVFLQHGAYCSATIWINLGNHSFAFMLSDAGYDVWMGNFRGTLYSPKHVYLSPEKDSNKYWNFSFHELGLYDIPAQFDVVRRVTLFKHKIHYVGHSEGTISAYVYNCLRPDHATQNAEIFISWSPVAFLGHVKSPLKLAAPFADVLMTIGELTNTTSGLTYHGFVHHFVEFFCMEISMTICKALYQFIFGLDLKYFSPEWLPIAIYQSFAGFSMKSAVHQLQIINAHGRFQWYNYGKTNNVYFYQSKIPPKYDVKNIKVPMYLMYGGRDLIAVEEDVLHLYNSLAREVRYGILKINAFDHMDFLYGNGITHMLHIPTLEVIERVNSNNTKI